MTTPTERDRAELATIDVTIASLQKRRQRIVDRLTARKAKNHDKLLTVRDLLAALDAAPEDFPVMTTDGRGVLFCGVARRNVRDLSLEPPYRDRRIPMTSTALAASLRRHIDGEEIESYKGYLLQVTEDTRIHFDAHAGSLTAGLCVVGVRQRRAHLELVTRDMDV
jgi:hypothetical protein